MQACWQGDGRCCRIHFRIDPFNGFTREVFGGGLRGDIYSLFFAPPFSGGEGSWGLLFTKELRRGFGHFSVVSGVLVLDKKRYRLQILERVYIVRFKRAKCEK